MEQINITETEDDIPSWIIDIEEIICVQMNGDNTQSSTMVEAYENIHKRKFVIDHNRYIHSYLDGVNLYKALHIYDTLNDESKRNFIEAIKMDHEHLEELVVIHESIVEIEPYCNTIQ